MPIHAGRSRSTARIAGIRYAPRPRRAVACNRNSTRPCPHSLDSRRGLPLHAWQIDSYGVANDLKLGEFLDDEETKAVFRDRACVNTLSYKATLLGPLITKADAIANSNNWVVEEDADDDDEPPASADAFPECVARPSSAPGPSSAPASPDPAPATAVGGKRKSRSA